MLRIAGHDANLQPDGSVLVHGAGPEGVGRIAAANGLVLTDLRPADRGLEDLFFQLTDAS